MNFYELLKKLKAVNPDHIAFSYYRGNHRMDITIEQWVKDVFTFAGDKIKQGTTGKNVGVVCRNCYEWYVVAFGLIISGNVIISINRDLPDGDIIHQLKKVEAEEVYCDSEEMQEELFAENEIKIHSIHEVLSNIQGITQKEENFKNYAMNEAETALVLFSSGTGGEPKGVRLSQKNLLAVCDELQDTFRNGKMLLVLPLYHISGVYFSLCFLRYMVTICICESPKYLVQDTKKYNPTIIPVVPAQLEFLMNRCKKDSVLLETLKKSLNYVICVGAKLDNEYQEECSKWGFQIINLYGLTETAGSLTKWFPHRLGSVGIFAPQNEMKIVEGELLVRGPSVMIGYYNNPQATQDVFRKGWLYTGDVVCVDEDGFLFLKGRKKNVIILANGENVSPEELESKIQELDQIKEVIVRGDNGVLEAVVFIGENANDADKTNVKESIKKLNLMLPHFQQIQRVTFQDREFEKTGSGKIKRVF